MPGVFNNFCFIIVDSIYKHENIEDLLHENGCQYAKVVSSGIVSRYLKSATRDLPDFIIDETDTRELFTAASKLKIPVVDSYWALSCIERNKLIPVEPFQSIRATNGYMRIHISRYSFNEHERKFLTNLVYLLGGYVTESLSPNSITQYITKSNEEEEDKIQKAMRMSDDYNDVYFEDEKWLLGEFYKSRYNNQIIESVDEEDDFFDDYSHRLIFKGYKFMINLQMCESLTSHLSTMIKIYGGSIISREQFELQNNDDMRNTTVYLSEFNGNEKTNKMDCIHKFNLQWVFDCFLQHQFIFNKIDEMIYSIPTTIQRQLCDKMKISYTQFFGLKRRNIINQIEMLGGEAQSFVCKDTDLLIVGKPQGAKYEYAKKNDICMVTSQWLEDTFKTNERVPYFTYDPIIQKRKDQYKPINLTSQLERQHVFISFSNERNDMDEDITDTTTNPLNARDAIITSSPSSVEENEDMSEDEYESDGAVFNPRAPLSTASFLIQPPKSKILREPTNAILASLMTNEVDATPVKRSTKRKKSDCMDDTEPLYDIHCVATQCLEKLSERDKELLKTIGIYVYEEINNTNIDVLNTVIAPKRLRTLKFLISLSFEPLKYALLPDFIMDILKSIKPSKRRREIDTNGLLRLDPMKYSIPGMDEETLKRTEWNNKVFARNKITNINLSANMQGGTNTLKSILQRHGIETVNVLKKKFTLDDVVRNNTDKDATTPEYILITDQQSQMKQFKSVVQPQDGTTILIVEWNWCVQCIFNLEVSYDNDNDNDNSSILYYA
ncbi:hypothetical protein MOSE0_B01244 [Monosporozyma servazzii]